MQQIQRNLSLPQRRSTRLATGTAFFTAGFGMAAWAPMIPFVKRQALLDDAMLGLLLLGFGLGSIVAMPISGVLASRYGCRRILQASFFLVCIAYLSMISLNSVPQLSIALILFGAGIGAADCVANVQATIVERASGRPMMSGFHGMFSLGTIAGASGVSGLTSVGVSPVVASWCVAGLILVAVAVTGRHWLPFGSEAKGSHLALPHGFVLLLGLMCFVAMLAEGAMLDWSAIFLTEKRSVTPASAGFGYSVFAAFMTAGRFMGDSIVKRCGQTRTVIWGSLLAAAGFGAIVCIPQWQASLAGFVLVGIGLANIAPILFSLAGAQRVMPENVAIPVLITIGYAGVLIGPAIIGLVAQASSLQAALAMVGICLVLLSLAGFSIGLSTKATSRT